MTRDEQEFLSIRYVTTPILVATLSNGVVVVADAFTREPLRFFEGFEEISPWEEACAWLLAHSLERKEAARPGKKETIDFDSLFASLGEKK